MITRLLSVALVSFGLYFLAPPRCALAHDVYVQAPPLAPPPAGSVYVVAPSPPVQQVLVASPPPPVVVARDESVSVLRYGAAGFFAGGLAGLSAGYLATDGGRAPDAWRSLLLASGIGALTLTGLGIGLGVIDAGAARRPSPARYVMRDAAYGTLLGAAFGGTTGGLVALKSRRGSDALLGASIGALSGLVLGGLVGALEGRWRHEGVVMTVGALRDVRGQRVVSPGVVGHF